MIANRIPGGIMEASTEFFTVNAILSPEPMCIHGGHTYDYANFPLISKAIVYNDMKGRPSIDAYLAKMVGNDEESKLKRYIMCRYGALNDEPDIDTDGVLSEPEYVPCNNRGNCAFEGRVCCSIMVKEGLFLSKSETEIFKRVRLADKIIADQLFISVETVKKHFQNIRKKTGLNNKIEIAIWATQKGII